LPREEEESQLDGNITSGAPATPFTGKSADIRVSGTSVTDSAPDIREAQQGSKGPSIPTTIAATATPRQQFVAQDVTITGRLTANGAPVAGGLVKLYSDDEGLWYNISSTTTDAHGGFAFAVQQPTAGTRAFKVAYTGTATHEPSELGPESHICVRVERYGNQTIFTVKKGRRATIIFFTHNDSLRP